MLGLFAIVAKIVLQIAQNGKGQQLQTPLSLIQFDGGMLGGQNGGSGGGGGSNSTALMNAALLRQYASTGATK
jgi:hypothetical protein